MPQINTTNTSRIYITLASASLATVVVVEPALSLVPVTVLVATVLQVFHGLSQELFLLLALRNQIYKLYKRVLSVQHKRGSNIWFGQSCKNKLPAV